MSQDPSQPVASSSKVPSAAPKLEAEPSAAPPGRRVVASRFLDNINSKSATTSSRKSAVKKSFITSVKHEPTADSEWEDAIDPKGKGRAGPTPVVKGGSYVVPSKFMLPPQTNKRPTESTSQPPLSSSTSTSATRQTTTSTTASRPSTKPRSGPPPSRPPTTTRPIKPKPATAIPSLPPLPPSPGSVGTSTTARSRGETSGASTAQAPSGARGSAKGEEMSRAQSSVGTTAGGGNQSDPKTGHSWVELAQSLGTSTIPNPASAPSAALQTQAQGLFLILANMQLTVVSEDRIMAGTTVLKNAQERLTKAEEEVKEDIERERLLKEIELLDSLLDPKVGRKIIPVLFAVRKAQKRYDALLKDAASESPPSHHILLPSIKDLRQIYTDAIAQVALIPRTPDTPLSDVLDKMDAQNRDRIAVLGHVQTCVKADRDELREKLMKESQRLGRNFGP